jgi:hypothetical protein
MSRPSLELAIEPGACSFSTRPRSPLPDASEATHDVAREIIDEIVPAAGTRLRSRP